jgi:hypothetical protein
MFILVAATTSMITEAQAITAGAQGFDQKNRKIFPG